MLYPYFIGKDGKVVGRAHTMDESFVLSNKKPYYLTEGLIKTYPTDIVCKTIGSLFHLSRDDDFPRKDSDKQGWIGIVGGHNGTEQIQVQIYNAPENIEQMKHYFSKYGYFPAGETKIGKWIYLYFEKKYDIDVTETVHGCGYLYHMCKGKTLNKILSQGLTPRVSQWGEQFKNPERVYFSLRKLSHEELNSWAKYFKKEKNENETVYILLQIDVNKINPSIKFYYDSRMPEAVYTNDTISPKAISVEDCVRIKKEEEA